MITLLLPLEHAIKVADSVGFLCRCHGDGSPEYELCQDILATLLLAIADEQKAERLAAIPHKQAGIQTTESGV